MLKGALVAIVTPFREDGQVDEESPAAAYRMAH